jgi:uncharacterized lipoprotein YajG
MPLVAVHASPTVNRCSVVVVVAIALLAGCAPVDRQPTLNYPPATASDAQAAAPKNKQIVLNPFLDHRADRTNVGIVSRAFGLRETEVVPANDVAGWVIEGLKTELENEGYFVTLGSRGKDNLPGASAAVSGVIVDVSCNSGHSGKVEMIGKVNKAGKEVLNKAYSAQGSARALLAPTAQACAQSLTVALTASVKRFVAEIDSILAN